MAAIGASRPLRRIPAIVPFLNPQPPLSLGSGNRSSCPFPDLARARHKVGPGALVERVSGRIFRAQRCFEVVRMKSVEAAAVLIIRRASKA